MGASVTLTAPAVAVEPGSEATLEFRLRNTGAVVDEFTLGILGDAAGWAAVIPPTVSLFPGAEETGRIVFRPPRSSAVPAGTVPFGLHAVSREDPAGSTVEEGTVTVGPFQDPFAELVPRTSRGSRSASHDLAVDNRGNVRLNAEVEAADVDRHLQFDVKPPGVVVEPGMAQFAKVQVKPVKRFWRGSPKTRPFQLVVRSEGAPPVTLDGALLQEAMLPPWFARAVMALIALLIALIILWLFVLKPSIESAASEAVASPLGELRSDINEALENAGLPTMGPGEPSAPPSAPASGAAASDGGAGGSGSPPTPTPTVGGPFIPGLGNPVDGRLVQNSRVVPAGTLFLTDIVFSNPNGREGAIVLLRDGEPLIEETLANFRSLDYHFVTPIIVPAGHELALSLTCTAGDQCDPSVLYSGYLRP
ncbi:MAG TPA: hypothetical protein VFO05_09175 [Candidatus Limnocylindrales bacterium]|nr:hypothetical protein [Candidatus Limnocylindrales bacterium]